VVQHMPIGNLKRNQAGFTYLTVLFLIAVAGIVLAKVGVNWGHEDQREREIELLFIGNEYRQAIKQYYERTPGAVKRYPGNLEDLLNDTRYNPSQHYLRKLYRDPFSNRALWGLIGAPEGGISGVYSLSNLRPIKLTGFDQDNISFEGGISFSDWKFVYVPPLVPQSTH
jgi:type II secretory pathway pseudopilin PulG